MENCLVYHTMDHLIAHMLCGKVQFVFTLAMVPSPFQRGTLGKEMSTPQPGQGYSPLPLHCTGPEYLSSALSMSPVFTQEDFLVIFFFILKKFCFDVMILHNKSIFQICKFLEKI